VAAAELVGVASFGQAGLFRPQGDAVAVQAGFGVLLWLLATSGVDAAASVTRDRQDTSARRCRTQLARRTGARETADVEAQTAHEASSCYSTHCIRRYEQNPRLPTRFRIVLGGRVVAVVALLTEKPM
jgi:hypothetical protein